MDSHWPEAGSYLGHYRLVEKIDEGGMGAVFKAHEAALDRFVAVKVLSPQMAKDAEFVHSFLREARAVAAMNHPNIIQIYFIGQHDEFIYFAMELVEGHAFDRLLRAKSPTPKEWLGYIRQAALGLQYAQNHGVIHRDVKPANLILNELGMVKVTDFGLARNTAAAPEANDAADTMGTPEYMSPEEAAGDPVDHRSDIYSLGATLYHMIAGKPPFSGSSGTEVMMHQMHTPLPSVRKINPQVPQSVAGVVEKCMAKKPEARFQTYDELIRGIDDALNKKAATRVHVPQQGSTSTTFKPQQKGPGAVVWLVILGIIAAAGFGIYKISEAQKQAKPKPLEQPEKIATPKPKPVTPVVTHREPPVRPVVNPVPPGRETPVATNEPAVPGRRLWMPLELGTAFNANVLSRKPNVPLDPVAVDGGASWYTTAALKLIGRAEKGLPDDGVVAIPDADPAGQFNLFLGPGKDMIALSGPGGPRGAPVQVAFGDQQSQQFEQLSFLTWCSRGNGMLAVTLHYADGPDEVVSVELRDWYALSSKVPTKHAKVALSCNSVTLKEPRDFYAQTVPVNKKRILRGLTLAVRGYQPMTGPAAAASSPAKFSAGVLAISGLPARLVDDDLWKQAGVDVLKDVVLPRDVAHDSWSKNGTDLVSGNEEAPPALLEIGALPQTAFDLRISFTPQDDSGSFAVVVDRGAQSFLWLMNAGKAQWFGIEGPGAGMPVGMNNPLGIYRNFGLVKGFSHDCVISFRRDKVSVVLDDARIASYTPSEWKNLSLDAKWRLRTAGHVGIGTLSLPVVIHSIRVIVNPDAATAEAPAETPKPPVVVDAPPAVAVPAFSAVAAPLARLIGGMQIEMAESEAQRLAQTGTAAQKAVLAIVQRDIRRLLAFRYRTSDSISEHAGKNVSLQLRSGQRIDAQLVSADSTEIKLRKQFAAGFGETRARWFDILPVSILPLFASAVDPAQGGEMYDYGLLLFYQSFTQQARPEDVRRAFTTALEREAALKDDIETHLKWLDEWGALPTTAGTTAAESIIAAQQRPERGVALAAGLTRWNWRCFEIGSACNADVIFTESRAATEEFQGGLGWTTTGWLTRNNIAGDFNGIPDDGRVLVADNDPRLIFSVTMPPKKNVILLTGEGGRQPRPVRLDLPADLQGAYRRLSFLHASAGGDVPVSAELLYSDGTSQTKHLQALNWEPGGRTHDLSPDQVVAIATRSNRITVMSRLEMIAEIIDADSDKTLVAVILSFDAARAARAGTGTTAAIFGLSGAPVGGTK